MVMHISIDLKETYIDALNKTLTVEFYKNWTNKEGEYQRLLCTLPGIPSYQARAIKSAVDNATPASCKVLSFPAKLKLIEET